MKLLYLSVLLISVMHEGYGQLPQPVANQTTMVLYLQDYASGPNATVAAVTGIKGKDWSYNTFGTIFVVDDPVMMSPSPGSTVVGRAQGLLTASDHEGNNVNVVLSIVFTNSQYSGSSLEIQGVSRQRESYKELSVLSGTGKFRFARGYAALQTAFYDPPTTHSVIRLTLTISQT
ncbi:dirigent protein 23 [Cajanus cajan]|uniref:Dirigent protein n=1 Tax=Cajanus cajan TaxID=3821 RepID=A0A151S0B9_CAJCA|nr:dirigent protein 23 [Cajanus cajan]KYP48275.1 Disease resistance response protein 206 family [Cajanus cajan]